MASFPRALSRAVALNELKNASGVTASALRSLESMRDNAMTGVDSGRAVVGSRHSLQVIRRRKAAAARKRRR